MEWNILKALDYGYCQLSDEMNFTSQFKIRICKSYNVEVLRGLLLLVRIVVDGDVKNAILCDERNEFLIHC